jgi:hypothetical protein
VTNIFTQYQFTDLYTQVGKKPTHIVRYEHKRIAACSRLAKAPESNFHPDHEYDFRFFLSIRFKILYHFLDFLPICSYLVHTNLLIPKSFTDIYNDLFLGKYM